MGCPRLFSWGNSPQKILPTKLCQLSDIKANAVPSLLCQLVLQHFKFMFCAVGSLKGEPLFFWTEFLFVFSLQTKFRSVQSIRRTNGVKKILTASRLKVKAYPKLACAPFFRPIAKAGYHIIQNQTHDRDNLASEFDWKYFWKLPLP